MTILGKTLALFRARDRVRVYMLLVALVIAAGLETIGVGLVMPFIGLVTQPGIIEQNPIFGRIQGALGAENHSQLLTRVGLLLLAYYVLKNGFLAALVYAQNRFIYGQMHRLAARLLSTYLFAPYVFHLERNSAELQRNLNTNIPTMLTFVVAQSFILISDVLVVTLLSAFLIVVSPVASLVAMTVFSGVGFVYIRVIQRRTQELGRQEQRSFAEMVKWVNQGLGALKEVRVRGIEGFFLARYAEHCGGFVRARRTLQTATEIPRLLLETLAVTGVVVVTLVALARGQSTQTLLPLIGLFAAASFRLLPAVTRIIRSLYQIKHFRPSFDSVVADLGTIGTIPDDVLKRRARTQRRLKMSQRIELRNVAFTYARSPEPVLRGVSLRIAHGQCVGLVGPSGAGKTTVADLILGLFPPTSGEILADGQDISEDLPGWRANFGYIPQTIYLTDDTIRRNVAFGVPDEDIDDEAVRRALADAQLTEFVDELPGGLDHIVGETGERLSGGQRQRIGIARALYHDPPILVMDEATSALDTRTEREITETTVRLAGSRTVIVIAHRLSTVERCDRLFFLKDGLLAAEGTYQELASSSPDFRKMANLT